MSYHGLGVSASISITPGRQSARTAAAAAAASSLCATRGQKAAAAVTCALVRRGCDIKDKPVCGVALPTITAPIDPIISSPTPEAQSFLRSPATPGGPPARATLTTAAAPGRFSKLPVPAAAPVVTALPPPEEPGVPMWVWIAGGAAVLGTGAFLYSRRKGA